MPRRYNQSPSLKMLFLPFWLRFGTRSGSPLSMALLLDCFSPKSLLLPRSCAITQTQWRSSYCLDIALSTPISIALVSLSNPPVRVATHLNVSLIFCLTAQISPSCVNPYFLLPLLMVSGCTILTRCLICRPNCRKSAQIVGGPNQKIELKPKNPHT